MVLLGQTTLQSLPLQWSGKKNVPPDIIFLVCSFQIVINRTQIPNNGPKIHHKEQLTQMDTAITYTWKGTMGICKSFKPDGEFNITWTNYVLNLEILKRWKPSVLDKQKLFVVYQSCVSVCFITYTKTYVCVWERERESCTEINFYLELSWKTKLLNNSSILKSRDTMSDWKKRCFNIKTTVLTPKYVNDLQL